MEPARTRVVQERAHQKSVAPEETEITFLSKGLARDMSTPCISNPGTWNRRGRERFKEEHKRLLAESFMRSRLHARKDGLFLFSFWIVLCTQVLNNHQFDHSTKSIIDLLSLTQQHIELIRNTIPVWLARLYSSWHVGYKLTRKTAQYLFGSPDFTRVGTLVPD